jgi:hypothetical protein
MPREESQEMTPDLNPDEFPFYDTSPDAGDPDCICSYCGFGIPEDDEIFRLFLGNSEARFHNACFKILVEL